MFGQVREINLETGMPLVDAAVKRLTYELSATRHLGFPVLKIIHGYGSSGTGGRIRVEVRRYLQSELRRGRIKCFIEGERFSIFDEDTRRALDICGPLRNDRDLDRHNNGITFVVL